MTSMPHLHFFALATLLVASTARGDSATTTTPSYGVDCSMPIHHVEFDAHASCGDLLGDRKAAYRDFMKGCRDQFGWKCDNTEHQRVGQMQRQPKSLLNYTDTGYAKLKAPQAMMELILDHWDRNKDTPEDDPDRWEVWTKGHTYVNQWQHNTTFYDLKRKKWGGSMWLQNKLYALAKPILEEWTGMELQPTSLYGIRVYHQGAILMPHVDRNPLISSAIINVAQDPDMTQDWPLEVYGRDGQAVNISMVPGDMVLYESHTLIHGRPFPLQGKYYSNVFVHFEPTGRLLQNKENDEMEYDSPANPAVYEGKTKLPPYILPGSEEAKEFKRTNPWGWGEDPPEQDDLDWWDDFGSSNSEDEDWDSEEEEGEWEEDEEEWEEDEEEEWEEEWEEEGYDEEEWDEEEEEWDEYDGEEEGERAEEETRGDEGEEESFEEVSAQDGDATSTTKDNNPSCPGDMDPAMAPTACLSKLKTEQRLEEAIS